MYMLEKLHLKFIVLLLVSVFLFFLLLFPPPVSAQSYNCGAYGAGTYGTQENQEQCEDEEDLEKTGEPVLIGVVLGSSMIIVGLASFVITHRHSKNKK